MSPLEHDSSAREEWPDPLDELNGLIAGKRFFSREDSFEADGVLVCTYVQWDSSEEVWSCGVTPIFPATTNSPMGEGIVESMQWEVVGANGKDIASGIVGIEQRFSFLVEDAMYPFSVRFQWPD